MAWFLLLAKNYVGTADWRRSVLVAAEEAKRADDEEKAAFRKEVQQAKRRIGDVGGGVALAAVLLFVLERWLASGRLRWNAS